MELRIHRTCRTDRTFQLEALMCACARRPFWPRARYLELAPKYWAATRARIDRTQLEKPVGFIDVPEPL